MDSNLLEILDSSNSIKNEASGEIIITIPNIKIEGSILIDTSCKISSNCNTIIACQSFTIYSPSVSITNINFRTTVVVKSSNDLSISNCTIEKAERDNGALMIKDSKNVLISNVTITGIESIPGIFMNDQSTVTADNLTVNGLKDTLVALHNNSKIRIRDSNFHHSQANGFYLSEQSSIEITNSKITNTKYPAFYLTDGSNCIIRKSEINNIEASAVDIEDKSFGIIEETTFSEITKNVLLCYNSEIQTKNNTIYNPKMPAIGITAKGKATIYGDKIFNSTVNCIASRGASEVTIDSCEISDVCQAGFSISDTEKVTIKNCKVKNCEAAAVEAYNNSKVEIMNTEISNMKRHAFLAFTAGYIKAENNKISDVGAAVVKLVYKGSGDFINNQILKNCSIQCECETSSPYFFNNNGNFTGRTNDASRACDSVILDKSFNVDNSLCLLCKKKHRDAYLVSCGHKVYCKDCAKKALDNHEVCPLCRFPIDDFKSGFCNDDNTCIICLENKIDCIVLPCGHICACEDCLNSWFKNKQVCPICRAEKCFYKKIEYF